MKFVRREFLQLAGAAITVSGVSHSPRAQTQAGGPSPIEILRSDLIGQDHKVTETLVTTVTFPPGSVSSWHVHPGAQELVFGLEGKLTLEIEGWGANSIGVGETGLVPSDVPHTVRNETASEPAKILVVYSRSDKDQPVRVDLKKV
ncbi:MAG TPA: cupin domain-containing protein [Candidatus Binatia bacterium]|nr:cupin domain-containing protein [Candidatus Binatia bacterium]